MPPHPAALWRFASVPWALTRRLAISSLMCARSHVLILYVKGALRWLCAAAGEAELTVGLTGHASRTANTKWRTSRPSVLLLSFPQYLTVSSGQSGNANVMWLLQWPAAVGISIAEEQPLHQYHTDAPISFSHFLDFPRKCPVVIPILPNR